MDYSELAHIIAAFPDAKTIELKKAGLFNDFQSGESNTQKFSNVKKFIFNHRGETQIKNLNKIFKNTNTQLVPIFSNSA